MPKTDVAQQTIDLMVHTIGRKTSEGYAVLVLRDVIKKLRPTHPCLQYLEVQDTHFIEFGTNVHVDTRLEDFPSEAVGKALQDILLQVLATMRRSAGFFLIKELRDRLSIDDLQALMGMGVDLNLMQFSQEVKSREVDLLAILPSDVVRRVLKTLLFIIEAQSSREFAFRAIETQLHKTQERYPFLTDVAIHDIHITLGTDEVFVPDSIDSADPRQLGAAIEQIIFGANSMIQHHGGRPILHDLKNQLTADYLAKLQSFGLSLTAPKDDPSELLRQVILTLTTLLGKVSTEDYAIYAINTFLRPEDPTSILRSFTIQKTSDFKITVLTSLTDISDNDARHAIQRLLENILRTMGGKLGDTFIAEFQKTLDKTTLERLEEIGVNLHIFSLQQEIRAPKPGTGHP